MLYYSNIRLLYYNILRNLQNESVLYNVWTNNNIP